MLKEVAMRDEKTIDNLNTYGQKNPCTFALLCIIGSPFIWMWGMIGSALRYMHTSQWK